MNISDFEIFRKISYSPFQNGDRNFLLSDYPYLDIVLNDHCNAKCKFCVGHLVHKRVWADVENIKVKARYAIENLGVHEVLLLGGEPTINDSIFEVIDFLKEFPQVKKICTTTNGHRFIKHPEYIERFAKSGITHVNISLMHWDPNIQMEISGTKISISEEQLANIYSVFKKYGVILRLNCNVLKGGIQSLQDIKEYYSRFHNCCDSMKFSPLLKTDSFSTVDTVTEFNRTHILSDQEYDDLWHSVEYYFHSAQGYPIVRNKETFGFVEYSMLMAPTPVILNYNQHGQLRKKIIEEKKINNIKLLATGTLSLSWNREEKDYIIRTE